MSHTFGFKWLTVHDQENGYWKDRSITVKPTRLGNILLKVLQTVKMYAYFDCQIWGFRNFLNFIVILKYHWADYSLEKKRWLQYCETIL